MKEPLLTVNNLHLSFKTERGILEALRGVTFQIGEGEIVGLVGESGCGKSLTASAILQLFPATSKITAGDIQWKNESLLCKSESEIQRIRGKSIGMIFQDPTSALNPTLSIGFQIMEPLFLHEKMSKAQAYQTTVELLKHVGMGDPELRMKQYPHELSGGMRQRVAIAMAFACQPSLIIADEPTTALDVTIQAQILDIMKSLRELRHSSILIITHDLGVVAHLCDRVLVMYAGQIVEEGSAQQLFSSPQHPYTCALIKSKMDLIGDPDAELYTIPGAPPVLLNPPKRCAFAPRCANIMKICIEESPPLVTIGSGHQAACWKNREITQ